VIAKLSCAQDQPRCARGDTLTVQGEGLRDARIVTFLGNRGRQDDRRARPALREDHLLTVRVPSSARSGTVRVTSVAAGSARSRARVVIRPGAPSTPVAGAAKDRLYVGGTPAVFRYRAPASAAGRAFVEAFRVADGAVVARWPVTPDAGGVGQVAWNGTVNGVAVPVGRYAFRVTGQARDAVAADGPSPAAFDVFDAIFPIRGKHDLGQSATNNFGGGRGHMGQDMFAACGTKLVAARGGTVTFAEYQSRAGNYVVIGGADKQSYAYMHMRGPSPLRKGQRVLTGQTVGEVGESGRASGCHLHFEMWTAPGWYQGGKAFDPLPELTRWDAFS
jgi:murein DD-endopeptidase MepM/ murein hydrolase activator NlpD